MAVVRGQTSPALGYFQFCRGLSEYRQGRYAPALEWFALSRKAYAATPPELGALNSLFEAMALHQLGHTEEARQSLATASKAIDKRFGVRKTLGATGTTGCSAKSLARRPKRC